VRNEQDAERIASTSTGGPTRPMNGSRSALNEDACPGMTVLISNYPEPILVTLTLSCCSSAVEVGP
jgi:hypothetical protein